MGELNQNPIPFNAPPPTTTVAVATKNKGGVFGMVRILPNVTKTS